MTYEKFYGICEYFLASLKAKEILKIAGEETSEIRNLAKEVIEEAKKEVNKLREAVEAGVDAGKHEFSKEEDMNKTKV